MLHKITLMLLTLFIIALTACSGGGSGSGTDTNTDGGDAVVVGGGTGGDGVDGDPSRGTISLKFFHTNDGELRAIDPLNPTAPALLIDANAAPPPAPIIASAITVARAEYDTSTATANNTRVERIFYSRSDGTLWQVDAARQGPENRAETPPPTQVSAEFEATQLCGAIADFALDSLAIAQAQVVYALPGPDQDCSASVEDNIWRVVRLDMDSSQLPLDFPGVPQGDGILLNPVSGAPAGWFSKDANTLLHVSPDLDATPLATIDSFVTIYGQVRSGHAFVNLDGRLHIFDLQDGGALVDTGYDFTVGPLPGQENNLTIISDGERIFFVAVDDSGPELFVAEVSGVVASLHKPTDAAASAQINAFAWHAGNRIIFGYDTDGNNSTDKLVSLTKDGAELRTILESDFDIGLATPQNDDYVYVQRLGADGPPQVVAVRADGSEPPIRFENSVPAGFSLPTNVSLFRTAGRTDAFFVLEGIDGALDGVGGATLLVVDPSNPSSRRVLGQVTDAFDSFFPAGHLGRYALAQASQTGASFDDVRSDIFFLDTETPGSLLRVSNTADVSEFPIR